MSDTLVLGRSQDKQNGGESRLVCSTTYGWLGSKRTLFVERSMSWRGPYRNPKTGWRSILRGWGLGWPQDRYFPLYPTCDWKDGIVKEKIKKVVEGPVLLPRENKEERKGVRVWGREEVYLKLETLGIRDPEWEHSPLQGDSYFLMFSH